MSHQRLAPSLKFQLREAAQFRSEQHWAVRCTGRWPIPCREAWPASRFTYCQNCKDAHDREKKPMTSREFVLMHSNGRCCYCGGQATQRDHVVASSLRKRHHIKQSDTRFHVSACAPCNLAKLSRRLYPRGFDTSILPGDPKRWMEWNGDPAAIRKVIR